MFRYLATTLLISASSAFAQEAKKDAAKTLVKVYDIRDLVLRTDSQPLVDAFLPVIGLGEPKSNPGRNRGGSVFGSDEPVDTPEAFIEMVQKVIDPDSWIAGGRIAVIDDNTLVVTQTAENHKQLEALFEGLRAVRRPTLTIRAHWFHADSAEMQRHSTAIKSGDGGTVIAVDREALEKLRPAKHSGQTSAANGRTVHISSGRARKLTVTVRSNVGGGTDTGYDPIVATLQDGVSLEVTPAMAADGKSASLTVYSIVADWPEGLAENQPAVVKPSDIDRINLHVHRLRATATVPVGRPVLIGSLTLNGKAAADGKPMHLVIEVVGVKP